MAQNNVTVDQNGKSYNRFAFILLLLVGTFFEILNETVLATAYPDLMKYFNINTSTVQWLTSAFLMVNGIMIPLSAWLIRRINTKWLYLMSLVIFLIGTIIAYTSTSFGVLLTARIIQAVSAGLGMPLLQTIMLYIFPPDKRGASMGLSGLVIGLAPAIGPTLSGWIVDNASWRDLFGMNIIPLIIVILLGLKFIKPVLPTEKLSVDYFSAILSTIGFGVLLYGFSSVGNDGWGSSTVLISLLIGFIFVGFFIWRDLTVSDPLVDLKVFKSPQFSIGTIIGSLAMMSMVGFEMVLPLYLQTVRGDSAFHSGLTLLAGALMIGILSPFTGQIFDKFGAKNLVISGFLILGIGTIPFIYLTKDTPVIYIVVLYAIRSVGIAMTMMPITTYSMNSLPNHLINHGTSANNTVRQVASSIATAVLTSVLSNTTNDAKPVKHLLTTNPLSYKNGMINAVLSGYHAAFLVAALFALVGIISAFFLRKGKGFSQDNAKEVASK
ncbi:MFS transporter [Philodulcilactobacillus myokoensis]|uniref:MFS transporter n=1 Tax=Philodulcilactobacillus myokoensis TaxID=2929573 RepID=A0A9W6ERI3_9LACO|nr:MDR family MFS transporter [Philodulcilactobacillus myokoensis]GLB46130.1 MFS transporter [Philodulcilactobacillus myokoensis]